MLKSFNSSVIVYLLSVRWFCDQVSQVCQSPAVNITCNKIEKSGALHS